MDVFDVEILKFWKALQDNKVQFIVVGGYATNLHGYQRFTGDMDIWIVDTLENRKQLRIAFNDYGIGDFEMMERMQFVPGWTNFYLNNGMQLDIMVDMKGLEGFSFKECLELASIADIDGVQVPFLQIKHHIANKVAVNLPKDQLDVIYLKKLKKC